MKYLLLTGLLLITSFTEAKQATSDLGYSIEIPDSWLPLTRSEIKENSDLFDFNKIGGVSPLLLERVMPIIRSGKMDIYFIPDNTDNITENISVIKQIGKIPNAEICAAGKEELTNIFQREITLHECKQTEVAGRKSFYIQFSGILEENITMQYHITLSDKVFLIFNATAKIDNKKKIESALYQVINTLNIR
ncbi:hypothetical protein [uncultured Psychromonas sp.]|uniref:hypothetical protein n=1 Tax=uncultured Psychromonas sp. TaxID=173974 RepID=UPI0026261492|nr:hypothetical protein [uncultured Psychromonas sp.]